MLKPAGWLVVLTGALCSTFVRAEDSRVRTWVSPNGKATLSSVRLGAGDGYRLQLSAAGHAPVDVDTYLRQVDVGWSPDGSRVAITDWIGSNVADCYVIDADHPTDRIDVASILPPLSENAMNSHFYVSCGPWIGRASIAVEVAGHTDFFPSHGFAFRFQLDVDSGRIRGAGSRGN